jgi:hypothetical protein
MLLAKKRKEREQELKECLDAGALILQKRKGAGLSEALCRGKGNWRRK